MFPLVANVSTDRSVVERIAQLALVPCRRRARIKKISCHIRSAPSARACLVAARTVDASRALALAERKEKRVGVSRGVSLSAKFSGSTRDGARPVPCVQPASCRSRLVLSFASDWHQDELYLPFGVKRVHARNSMSERYVNLSKNIYALTTTTSEGGFQMSFGSLTPIFHYVMYDGGHERVCVHNVVFNCHMCFCHKSHTSC